MKPLKFIFVTLTLCVLSSIFTICITSTFFKSKPVNQKEETQDLYSAELTLSQIFEKCGHTIVEKPETITYSSAEELTKRFPEYEIVSGDGNNLVMSITIDNYCPEHYIATLSNKKITITKLCNGEETASFKFNSQTLSEKEKTILEQGITLDSKTALTSFIEDFTS